MNNDCRERSVSSVQYSMFREKTPAEIAEVAAKFTTLYLSQRLRPDVEVAAETADCKQYRKSKGYDDIPVVPDAVDFPLAYNLLVHRDAHQVMSLLVT